MLEVYSQEKKALPIRGAVASVGLLAVSMALAVGVTAGRRRIPDIELGERVTLGDWPITVRGPAGWSAGGSGRTTTGFVFTEKSSSGRGRQLQFQRAGPLRFSPPSLHARVETIGAILRLPESRLEGLYRRVGSVPFGPLPGSLVMVGPLAIHFGVAPDGTLYWVLLESNAPIRPADLGILQEVTASIEWGDPPILEDPSSLWDTTPYRFDAPAGARFWRAEEESAGLICFGDPSEEGAWHIEVRSTFLAPGRKPAELVRDHLAWRMRGREPRAIDDLGGAAGASARAEVEGAAESEPVQSVAVRGLEGGAAVMLLGTADQAGKEALRNAEQTILRSLRRTGETEDLSAAMERGRRLRARVSRDVAEQWSDRDREWWYLIVDGDKAVGFQRMLRRTGVRNGEAGFYIEDAYYYGASRTVSIQAGDMIFVPREGDTVALKARGRRRTDGRVSTWELNEARTEGETTLRLEWSDDSGGEVSRTVPVDSSYMVDPLTEWAGFVVAAEASPDETFVISTSGHPLMHDVYWAKITPMGGGWSGGSAGGRGGLSVSVVSDFDPEPNLWFFDPDGNIREIRFGDGQRLVSISQREVLARFRGADRILAEMDSWWSR